jgi:hypothetical protein
MCAARLLPIGRGVLRDVGPDGAAWDVNVVGGPLL